MSFKYNNQKEKVWLGFDIIVDNGSVLKPKKIQFWPQNKFENHTPQAPFHYKADALLGLAMIHLNDRLKTPFSSPQMNYSFCHEAWLVLEPHHELFNRSQTRINETRLHIKSNQKNSEFSFQAIDAFERKFTEILDNSISTDTFNLNALCDLIKITDELENKMEQTLVYNLNLKFNKIISEKLHYLHSFLFNLRTLIALDHNAYIHDPTYEALKVDSITDYLPKAEYVTNDALLYLNFKNQQMHILNPAKESLENAFKKFCHNGYCLIESIPKSYLNHLGVEKQEETLYLIQMDWLLGSEAGLLFKIREELYGILDGYEKIFWPDSIFQKKNIQDKLEINCLLTSRDVYFDQNAA